jgi:cell division protein FtsB
MTPKEHIKKFFASRRGRITLTALKYLYIVVSTLMLMSFVVLVGMYGSNGIADVISGYYLLGVFLSLPGIGFLGQSLGELTKKKNETYGEKLTRLTGNLTQASTEVDLILKELSRVSIERAYAVQSLEEELKKLAEREQETKKRIQDLESLPISVAEHFAKLTEPSEKRGARRDYMLFVSGLIAGQLLQIILKVFGY